MTTLLLVLLGCAHSLGSSDLSADLSTGIGGLIVSYGPGPDPLAEEAWAKLRDTDAAFDALLAWPPMRWGSAGHDLERRFAVEPARKASPSGAVEEEQLHQDPAPVEEQMQVAILRLKAEAKGDAGQGVEGAARVHGSIARKTRTTDGRHNMRAPRGGAG